MRPCTHQCGRASRQFAARNRSALRLRDQPPKIGQSAKKRYEFAPTDAQYQTVRSCLNCVSAGPGRCPKTNKHRAWLQPIDPFQARVQPSENSAGRPGRRFGRPCPMALECLADSRANYFATADLTLMRSLRKNAISREKTGLRHEHESHAPDRILGVVLYL